MCEMSVLQELVTLRNDLLSAKNLIDQSPEVKTSRRLQGAITRCNTVLQRLAEGDKNVADEAVAKGSEAGGDG